MAAKNANEPIKVRNNTEAVLDLGTFENDDKSKRVQVILGSTLDDGRQGDAKRPIHQPKREFPRWAWDAAMRYRANQEHISAGRVSLGW